MSFLPGRTSSARGHSLQLESVNQEVRYITLVTHFAKTLKFQTDVLHFKQIKNTTMHKHGSI